MAVYGSAWSSMVLIQKDIGYGTDVAEGLTYEDFTVITRKAGGAFTEKTLLPESVVELGDGWYDFRWTTGEMNTIGEFYFKVIPEVDGGIEVEKIFDVTPPPLYMSGVHPNCIVTGNIVDIGGSPETTAYIVFRPRSVPVIAGPALLGATILRTTPDAFGNFSVRLLRNIQVLVEIEGAGIRHLITVPDMDTASIIDLLPPVPPPI